MAMMPPLHAALEAERNQQADGDGEDVKEKVFHAVNFLMRRMDVEHAEDLRIFLPASLAFAAMLHEIGGGNEVLHSFHRSSEFPHANSSCNRFTRA
jgi:hypothetical protein